MALMTLFDAEGGLDAAATAGLACELVDAGVAAVVVAGTTGEAAALERDERIALLDAVRGALPRWVPVIAGTGAPSARQAARYTADAIGHGATAVLALSPPGSLDLDAYYAAVADAAGGSDRVLAYHFPAASVPGIPVDGLTRLPVAGCKDSSGDPTRLLQELDEFAGDLYTGSSALLSFAGPLGCAGAILSLANLEPGACVRAFGGDTEAQRALVWAHVAAHERFPAGLKELVAKRYGVSAVTRVG